MDEDEPRTSEAPQSRSFVTRSGIPVAALYGPGDGIDPNLGVPGEPPYTRGVQPELYRDQLWIMGQYSGYSSPHETNERFHRLLAAGQTGFSIALDLPTQMGLESSHPLARGEVGKVGVPLNSLADMEVLLDRIPLQDVRQIRTSANAIGPILVAMFLAIAEKRGIDPTAFRVMLQNDSLKEYIARGAYIYPPRHALRFSADAMEYCAHHVPNWEPIEFCGYHIRDSGCTADQELAVAISNGLAYMEEVRRRELPVDTFGRQLVLFLSADLEILEEVAKFRAARRLWSRLMSERYGEEAGEARRIRIFCYTLGGSLTAVEPHNNLIRVAYQALAAVLGGVQTLATSSFDEALGLPSDFAVNLSLRTQQVLAYETGLVSTVDPLGGSYYVEHLTDEVERRARAEIRRIEDQGGAVAALESGYLQRMLSDSAYRRQLAVESGEHKVVALNTLSSGPETGTTGLVAHAVRDREAEVIENLRHLKERQRDQAAVEQALDRVLTAARGDTNTIPSILDAVRAYATVGEICDVLALAWGRHTPYRTID